MLIAVFGALSACSLFKKVPDACSVAIAPREVTVPVNGTTVVIGTPFDCDGNSIKNKTVKFSSSNTAVANVTSAGQVIGVSVGTATVSAVANGKTGDAVVTVTPERVLTVAVTPTTATVRRNQTQQMTAVAKNSQGVVITGLTFQWSSSNSSLASVDNTGKLTALAPGTVNISASTDGQSGTSVITVTEVPIGSCTLTPGTQKVTVTNQAVFTLALKDTASNPLSSNGRLINWTSDNNLIASVNANGVVQALKAGTAKITATDGTNAAISCNATAEVVDARIAFVNVTPVGANLRLGAQRQFAVAILDSNRTPISAIGRTITWKNVTPAIATVSASGIVIPIALGNGRVAVDAEGAVDTATYSVSKIPVVTVSLSPQQRTVVEGNSAQFTPTVTDSAGNVVTDRLIEWTSSNTTIATVSSTGLVTTTAPGTTTITAISETRSGTATLIITPVPVDTILLTQQQLTLNRPTASGTAQGAFSIDLRDLANRQLRNRTVIVTSDQPSIATGTANAAATTVSVVALTNGSATLTIQAVNASGQNEGKASKIVITVTGP
ncbi:MAG: Ig-like domain-containing protein [Gemmatimonadaceae bacterium]